MKNLIAALDIQLKLLEELHSLLQRETAELSEVHLDAMSDINRQKEEIAERIRKHSAPLRTAIEEASVKEGLTSKATLGELADRLKLSGIHSVPRLHSELNEVSEKLRERLSLNYEIAERFARSVASSLDLLARVINQTSTYGASGSYQQRPAAAVMVNREA